MTAARIGIAYRTVESARSQAMHSCDELVVRAHHEGDAVIVSLAGEFDLAAAHSAREALSQAISDPRQRLIVDLSNVTFMDSSGVHVILEVYELCRYTESTLTIRPGPRQVQRVFELTNLLCRLPFEPSG